MKKVLFYFAMTAWILAFVMHFLTFENINLAQYFPIFVLFIGVFVVWVPTVFSLRKNRSLQEYQSSHLLNRFNPVGFQKALFKNTPFWLKCIAIGSFVYGFINSILFFNTIRGVTGFQDGQYVLKNHGTILKVLTKQEFIHYEALETRGISGHLLVFYGIAAAVLYPFNKQEESQEKST